MSSKVEISTLTIQSPLRQIEVREVSITLDSVRERTTKTATQKRTPPYNTQLPLPLF